MLQEQRDYQKDDQAQNWLSLQKSLTAQSVPGRTIASISQYSILPAQTIERAGMRLLNHCLLELMF